MRNWNRSAVLAVTVVSALAIALVARQPVSAAEGRAADVEARLETALGDGRLLRDFAPFTTERGESAFLVLFVTGTAGPTVTFSFDQPLSCPNAAAGIGLVGTYHVGLVRDGALVNEVVVPCDGGADCSATESLSLPLANSRYNNHSYWGQGLAIEFDAPGATDVEPTKLITLADFTGDGHAWEFRLAMHGGACGHIATLLAGYSPQRRQAILFPIVSGATHTYWHANFYPPLDRPNATAVHYEFPCFDHGNQLRDDRWYEYNRVLEAWIQTRHERHLCVEPNRGASTSPNVQIRIGSARGRPGESVHLAVTVEPSAHVQGIELQVPLNDDFDVRGCTLNPATLTNDVRATAWGIETLQVFGTTDAPPVQPSAEMRLYTCELSISPHANLGRHRLSPSGFLVSDGWTRVPAIAVDGEIIIDAGPSAP